MENENKIVLNLYEINSDEEGAQLRDTIGALSGVECVIVNEARNTVSIIGAELSREDIIDCIEALGFTVA